ncbi:MAG: PEP/pyruvate-binding domain-containing protein [Deltaproteobacteria bacterium]
MTQNSTDKNKTSEEWTIGRGSKLAVEIRRTAGRLAVSLTLFDKARCMLHWGVSRQPNEPWQQPARSIWPRVQTPFTPRDEGSSISLDLPADREFSFLVFVLFFPEENNWDNNRGRNYFIRLPLAGESLLSPGKALAEEIKGREVVLQQEFGIEAGRQRAAAVCRTKEHYEVHLVTDLPGPLLLHWGEANRSRLDWQPPPRSHRPKHTVMVDHKAARTPFVAANGLNRLTLSWPDEDMPRAISFVLFRPDAGQWLKNNGANFHIPLVVTEYEKTTFASAALAEMANQIIEAETGRNSWTLMHRFNLCHDLLDRVDGDLEGLALLFVWLRFSSIRQLDWQRNYNTQPRELTHSQQRLTLKLAEHYHASDAAGREIIRLIFSTLGRGAEGGKGQRIRDDILHIMHRHHVKEVTGHFLEEWHQKLHNNATPDDIVICEAYLAFLRSNGDLAAFYGTLENGGVTRERLRGFERPIVTDPDFNPHIKDGLIHDFENYLLLLKSVHSATDLKSAVEAAGHCLAGDIDRAWHIYNSRNEAAISVVDRVREITALRRRLQERLTDNSDQQCIRDLLYLDLGMEEYLRVAVERNLHKSLSGEQLDALIGMLMENVRFSHPSDALTFSLGQWQRLIEQAADDREWFLHTRSVVDRVSRLLGSFIDTFYALLQPKAEHLGSAFNADGWTIDIFTQEVVRAGSPFVLSILFRLIDPILRRGAALGDWQVISHADAAGEVKVANLLDIQDRTYKTPTVLLTDKITGDEVIPQGVTAVLTAAGVDILSHVSIRARNAGVLFASCYNAEKFNTLKDLAGRQVVLAVDARGEVTMEKGVGQTPGRTPAKQPAKALVIRRPVETRYYAIAFEDFSSEVVGGKSNQLLTLKGKLPAWIRLPRSAALPFGVCERVLAEARNATLKKRYKELVAKVDGDPQAMLPELRRSLMELEAPAALFNELRQAMNAAGLELQQDHGPVWQCIKQVWASKWTERAYRSRRQTGIKHDDLFMAVLIQEVIGAEYAFVIHTANPFSGEADELYAEVAPGLGETICSGNYPGRALSFTCRKTKKLVPYLLSYPGKDVALRGSGLIFRSDSNGEDLEEFAGAGLYESVLLKAPRTEVVDYTKNTLLWNTDLRNTILKKIAATGIEVEKAMNGQAQDIEGAYRDGEYFVVQTRRQVGVD